MIKATFRNKEDREYTVNMPMHEDAKRIFIDLFGGGDVNDLELYSLESRIGHLDVCDIYNNEGNDFDNAVDLAWALVRVCEEASEEVVEILLDSGEYSVYELDDMDLSEAMVFGSTEEIGRWICEKHEPTDISEDLLDCVDWEAYVDNMIWDGLEVIWGSCEAVVLEL